MPARRPDRFRRRDHARARRRATLVLVLGGWAGLLAQPPAPTSTAPTPPATAPSPTPGTASLTPQFRTGVDLVEIDVRVTDAQGAPIADLTAEDLELRENGVLQRIDGLVRISLPLPAGAAPQAAGDDVAANHGASEGRIYTIVLDDLHVDGRRTLEVRRIARAFVDRVVAPGDQAAVLHASGRTDATQPFTSNRARLYEAIDRFVGRKLRSATLERQEVYNQFYRGNQGRPRPEDLRDTADQERAANARAALQTIASATTTLGRIAGRRKAVLLVSEGLDYDISGLTSQPASPGSGMSMTPGATMTGLDGGVIGRALGQLSALASRANVTFYTLDPRAGDVTDDIASLQAPPDDPSLKLNAQAIVSERRDAHQTLQGIAAQTGGFAMLGPGDAERMSRIARESSDYYLVRYYPDAPLVRGEFREVRVSVRRAGARVSARRGYFATPAPLSTPVFSASGIAPALGAALAAPLAADGLPLRLHAAALRGERKLAQVAVTTQVPGTLLASGIDGDVLKTTLEVGVLAVANETGAQSGAGSVVEIAADGVELARVRSGDYRVVSRLALPPGRYQLRVGVRDRRTDRLGVAHLDVDVPDFSERKPMLSGLVLASAVASLAATASDAETARLLPLLPTAVRRFTATDELLLGIEVYAPVRARRDLSLRTALEDGTGRPVAEARVPVAAPAGSTDDGTRHGWSVRLDDVPSGRYIVAAELWRDGQQTALARRETVVFVSGGARR